MNPPGASTQSPPFSPLHKKTFSDLFSLAAFPRRGLSAEDSVIFKCDGLLESRDMSGEFHFFGRTFPRFMSNNLDELKDLVATLKADQQAQQEKESAIRGPSMSHSR
ncbi:MAG: hypothetical protein EXS32_04005 [Opitutus sp.]|nr:hypothetical protein [Opitutus sp.]